jgi:hypothetical protein
LDFAGTQIYWGFVVLIGSAAFCVFIFIWSRQIFFMSSIVQGLNQLRMLITQSLASASRAPDPPARFLPLRPQVLQAPVDGLAAHPSNVGQSLYAAASIGTRLRGHQYSALQLVHQRQHTRKLQSQFARALLHPPNILKIPAYV